MLTKSDCVKAKLCPFSLGVALGVAKGLCMLLFAWAGYFWQFGTSLTQQIATVYSGYAPTLIGGLYGALWGLLGGFIFGVVIGLVYNFCLCCGSKMCNKM